jgi:hypothetical protein
MYSGIPWIAVGECPSVFKSYGKREAESYPTQDFVPGYMGDSLAARERIEQGDHTYE